jgi:uncharacterized protein (TIGR04255 family)
MVDAPRFNPIFPAHAIERCGITVLFKEPLPEKAFRRATARAAEAAAKKGFNQASVPQLGISIDVLTGKVGSADPAAGAGPQSFTLPDQSASLLVFPHLLIWQNSRYVRWKPFVGQFQDIVTSTLSEFLESVSLAAVKIEYWDRFNWTGTWDEFDAAQLIRPNAMVVANGWVDWRRQWHSHAGWFHPVENCRRLSNLNVDVGEMVAQPSVVVYTMMQDEPNIVGYGQADATALDEKYVFARLELLHRDLKSLLGSVLQDTMIKRISLNAEEA